MKGERKVMGEKGMMGIKCSRAQPFSCVVGVKRRKKRGSEGAREQRNGYYTPPLLPPTTPNVMYSESVASILSQLSITLVSSSIRN